MASEEGTHQTDCCSDVWQRGRNAGLVWEVRAATADSAPLGVGPRRRSPALSVSRRFVLSSESCSSSFSFFLVLLLPRLSLSRSLLCFSSIFLSIFFLSNPLFPPLNVSTPVSFVPSPFPPLPSLTRDSYAAHPHSLTCLTACLITNFLSA